MNTLYLGENLTILQDMPANSVDLIATDPPFNTGRDWGQFDDRWEGGLKGYLKFMEPRCIEMHRVLKETGSFYLHCDPTASHYLKVMLDGIFGIQMFRNEIVWKRQAGRTNAVHYHFSREHDILLFYTLSDDYTFNTQYQPLSEEALKAYKHTDASGRKYAFDSGKRKSRRTPPRRFYLDESKGIPLDNLWINGIQLASSTHERLGYPTQKPVALYQRIIKISSNEGDRILDPFAGSGTTLDAAQSLGRRWIGIDQNPEAVQLIEQRLTDRHALFLRKGKDYQIVHHSTGLRP